MRPTLLCLVDYYLPGVRAGGPVRSVAHLVERLGAAYRFTIVTRDRDLGDDAPYDGVPTGTPLPVGGAEVVYLPPGRMGMAQLRRLLRETPHDLLYLNSLFSARMTFAPLLLRRMRAVPARPVVLAPRGELHAGALATGTWWNLLPRSLAARLPTPRRIKKAGYLRACRALGLLHGVVWQASTEEEAEDIRRWIGPGARVAVAPNLGAPPPAAPPRRRAKQPRLLRLAYVSRVAPKKNLAGALRMLAGVRARVEFDVYGPIEDAAYWEECRREIASLPPNVRVRHHGVLEHARVPGALAEHDLMILPTRGENFGHVVLEALAAGCPVLLSDQTPWRGLESAGVGWDLPLSEPAAFTGVLERVAAMDDAEHRAWSARAAAYGLRAGQDEDALRRTRELFERALREEKDWSRGGRGGEDRAAEG